MKRLIIGIVIIVFVVTLGIFAIEYIGMQNARLYGKLEEVMSAYEIGEDILPLLNDFTAQAYKYAGKLTIFVNDEQLTELLEAAESMSAFYSAGDEPEFIAQAARLKFLAEKIYSDELPHIGRIF